MKLWILRPGPDERAWNPWYDKAFGFVVRAESEEEARRMASEEHGDEGLEAWLSDGSSSCAPLLAEGAPEVVIVDFRDA